MNEVHQIEQVTSAAGRIISTLQRAIFSSMEAAAQGIEDQTRMAATFQRLEAQEAIVDWLVERRIAQEEKLSEADLRPAQRALVERKIATIDEELTALLRSSGVEKSIAVGVVA